MEIVFRAAILYAFLWIVIRSLGRKELSSLSAFELVLLVVMGDLIQQGVTQEDQSITGAMLAIGTFALMVLALSFISARWDRARPVIDGVPAVVVRDGEPLDDVLRIERITVDDIKDAAREQSIASLREIEVGVLESDGKFSFLTYDRREPSGQPEASSPT
jgi:uncharacterized membrane protein YcaP (DUF421 family)